jgi:hypothetical protein
MVLHLLPRAVTGSNKSVDKYNKEVSVTNQLMDVLFANKYRVRAHKPTKPVGVSNLREDGIKLSKASLSAYIGNVRFCVAYGMKMLNL